MIPLRSALRFLAAQWRHTDLRAFPGGVVMLWTRAHGLEPPRALLRVWCTQTLPRLLRFAFRTPRRRSRRAGDACVIVLSWKRPANIDPIVRNALAARGVGRVLVCNNNPAVRMGDWLRWSDPRLQVIERSAPTRQGIRFSLADDALEDRFVWIDDDMFLSPAQIDALLSASAAEPGVVHGVLGEAASPGANTGYDFVCSSSVREGAVVDHITNVYCFDRQVLDGALALCDEVGIRDFPALGNGEDILLTRGGAGPGRVHDVGPFLFCASSAAADVATWRQALFLEERNALIDAIATRRSQMMLRQSQK